MWPFKPKPQIDHSAPFRAFRDIGETFNYLGRECVVTSHGQLQITGFSISFIPELSADYCDNEGVIRNINFSLGDLPILIKQNRGTK